MIVFWIAIPVLLIIIAIVAMKIIARRERERMSNYIEFASSQLSSNSDDNILKRGSKQEYTKYGRVVWIQDPNNKNTQMRERKEKK